MGKIKNKIHMGELIVLFGLFLFLSVPLITSRLAKRMGRRPWLWFCIGIVLPVIATLIVALLPDLSDPE
jgi:MFS family permease